MNDLKKPKKVRTPKNQWQTPGQVTDINSQHITMQGVGFDAIGVSPDGTRQYMKNGQDYYFPSKPVREYPLMQKGGSHIPKAQLGLGSFLQPISGKDVAKFFEMFSVPQKAVTKAITGKYQTPSEAMGIKNKAGAFVTDVLLDPVNLASGAGAVKATGIYKNAYKINPWAFKPDAKAAYRMIGSKGYDDALKTGYLKASTKGSDIGKVHTTTHYQIGVPSDKRMYSGRYWSRGYDGPYMAEVPNATTNPRFSYGPGGKSVGSEAMTFPENNVPLSEANIYKQDWLRGYKKVNVPNKKQNGGEEKGWFSSIASDIKNLFGIEEPKKKGVVLTMPKEMYIKDSRKVSRTTGKPINPNVELLTGKYPSDRIYGIVKAAKRYGIDPYDALAIDLQETGWGRISDGMVGHSMLGENQLIPSKLDDGDVDDFDMYARAIATKMQYADKLGYKDPEMRFQTYNGLGKIFPETEQDYHGFKMKKIYGVPVPKQGIDMKKNPLYGKRVMDIRDNVLKKNDELNRYIRYIKEYGGGVALPTYDPGGPIVKVQNSKGKVKSYNTNSPQYKRLYNQGIGSWQVFDQQSNSWIPSNPSNPNAEFVSSPKTLSEVVVTGKANPYISNARKQALEQIGSFEDFRRSQETGYPSWYRSSRLYNPDKDLADQQQAYDRLLKTRLSQNVIDAIPQKQGESRLDYMNRINSLAGKNFVSNARGYGLTEPFDPSNIDLMKQWGRKGLNHIAAASEVAGNPYLASSAIQKGIIRGNQPVSGLTAQEASNVGILQPFETIDDVAYDYGFKPLLTAGDNLVAPGSKNTRASAQRYAGPSETDRVFTSIMNPLNYLGPAEVLAGGKNLLRGANAIGKGVNEIGKLSAPYVNRFIQQPGKLFGKSTSTNRFIPAEVSDYMRSVETVDPETGISQFNKPGTKPAQTSSKPSYGRDEYGMFEQVNDQRIYLLDPPPSEITIGQPTRRSLLNLRQSDYDDFLQYTNAGDQISKEYLSGFNNILRNRGYDTLTPEIQNALRNSLNNRQTYADAVGSMVRSYGQSSRGSALNNNWGWGTANWNVTNNRGAFDKLTSYLGNKVEKVDKSLGKLFHKNQTPPTFDGNELLKVINQNLSKGMGVKKTSLPLEVRFDSGVISPSNNLLDLQTFVGGKPTGSITLSRNLAPYSGKSKKLSQILFGNRTNDPQQAWLNTIGFQKTGDFPFGNYSGFDAVQDATGKVFSSATDFYNVGLSGEFNKAINEALKSEGLGNVLSGGTGHSDLGKSRWEKLVNKGLAHSFGNDSNQSYYMLKKRGGSIIDPGGQMVYETPMMQKGGPAPIYVDNPNDPRLKAFKDSANVYNDFLRLKKMMDSKYASNEDYYVKKEDYPRNPDGSICYNCIKREAERKKAKDQFYSKDKQGFTQLVDPNIDPRGYFNYLKDNPVFDESVGKFQDYSNARPKQPVYYKKPEQKKDKFGLTTEDYIQARKTKWIPTPGNDKGDGYYDLKKDGKSYKVYTKSGGNSWVDVPSKPTPVKKTEPPKSQQLEPVRKIEQPKLVEIKQNMYEGSPVYYPTIGSGGPSALVGFRSDKGDTTFIQPEDYQRFAVPAYGKQYIESQTKQFSDGGQHGGLDRWFAEKWVDVKTGKTCGRQEGEKRKGYPACRPSKRISEDTPKTASELSSSEREKFKRSKTSSERINYQHRRKEYGGEQTENDMANKPNNPALWSRAKSLAKQKFDVYPSAYANGWAAKWYKGKGGTWSKAEYGMEMPMMEEGGKPEWLLEAQLKAQGYSGDALQQKMSSMAQGGEPQNPGFQALPEYVQAKILSNMGYGGYYNPIMAAGGEPNGEMALGQMAAVQDKMNKLLQFVRPDDNLDPWVASKLAVMDHSADAIADYMMYNPEGQEMEEDMQEMANGGYTVTRSNDRKGKTHKVTGPDGTVKYFGDSKLGQHPKDPERKAAFYARHKKNLANNPYFRAFARETWQSGGGIPAPITSPYSREYMQALSNEYDQFYAPPHYYGKDDGYDAFYSHKRKSFPTMKQDSGPGWLTTYSDGAQGFTSGDKDTPPKQRPGRKYEYVDSYVRDVENDMGIPPRILEILKNKKSNEYKPEYRRENYKSGGYIGQDGRHHMSSTPTWSGNAGYENGGPVVGDVMDVTPEQLEVLRQQGYQFEII